MIRQLTAKSLQIGGILLSGLALWTGMMEHSMRAEITILFVAILVFFSGWLIDEQAESP